MKKHLLFTILLLSICIVSGCTKTDDTKDVDKTDTSSKAGKEQDQAGYTVSKPSKTDQTTGIETGETTAIIDVTGYGLIKVRFFADAAPKAVENFITHAKAGYYNNTIFHRVIADFMVQGGDPGGDGTGGKSIWGESFEDEFSEDLLPIRGSLCMANSGPNTNGSQFFIVQTSESYDQYFKEFNLTKEQEDKFKEYGGTPWLKGAHTVFGQVYEGMDIVDNIAKAETGINDKPAKDIIIESITIQ